MAEPRTYTMNHPPLAPLASQVHDHPAEEVLAGMEILDDHIAAASMQKYSRTALMITNQATQLEVVAATKRETSLVLESVSTVAGAPLWAQALALQMNRNFDNLRQEINDIRQEMNDSLREMNNSITALRGQMNNLEDDVRGIRNDVNALSVQSIRNTNRNRLENDTIVPLRNHQGQLPPHDVFPQYPSDILTMEEQDVNTLLDFYGIIPETRRDSLNTKRRLLFQHLGLTYM
jgi:hypothetical protein